MPASQRIVQVCLSLFAAIAIMGARCRCSWNVLPSGLSFRAWRQQARLMKAVVHRFLTGMYLGTGIICLWAAVTVRTQVILLGTSPSTAISKPYRW